MRNLQIWYGNVASLVACGRNVGEVQKETEEACLRMVQNSENTNPWAITLLVNGKPVEFKIDTGADVTVIPKNVFDSLPQAQLEQT